MSKLTTKEKLYKLKEILSTQKSISYLNMILINGLIDKVEAIEKEGAAYELRPHDIKYINSLWESNNENQNS